ncbi:MAG: DEAD/DEAH box helicase, partial [Chryseobacterium sp.]
KIASEEEHIAMKNPAPVKLNDGGGAFHEKKAKNTKENWGGPSKRKAPKKFGANRAQQKAISKSKRKK